MDDWTGAGMDNNFDPKRHDVVDLLSIAMGILYAA
jgi:hypothetical protein